MNIVSESEIQYKLIRIFFALVFFILSIITIIHSSATGYEKSIYNAYPYYFWFLLCMGIIVSTFFLLKEIFNKAIKNYSKLFFFTFILIAFNCFFLLLPLFRGYYIYGRGDTLSHLAIIKDILDGASINDNFYPIVHLFLAEFSLISGLSKESISLFAFSIFYIFFILNMYLLASTITSNKQKASIILLFAIPLIFSSYEITLHPSMLAVYSAPLLLYLNYKRQKNVNSVPYSIGLIILIVFLTICHPISAFFILIILLILDLIEIGNNYLKTREFSISKNVNGYVILLISTTLLSWYLSQSKFLLDMNTVLNSLMDEEIISPAEKYTGMISESTYTINQIIELGLYRYLGIAILLIIASIGVLFFVYKRLSTSSIEVKFSFLLLGTVGFSVYIFFGGGLFENEPIRVFRFPLFISTIICGLFISYLHCTPFDTSNIFDRSVKIIKPLLIWIILILILSINISNIFNSYATSRTLSPNQQTTIMEVDSVTWLAQKMNTDNIIYVTAEPLQSEFTSVRRTKQIDRFFILISGYNHPLNLKTSICPSHFGYSENSSLFAAFSKLSDNYLVTIKFDEILPDIIPENIRNGTYCYETADIKKIKFDTMADGIYSNGEASVYSSIR